MSKQPTKADLEKRIKELQNGIHIRDEKIELLEKDVSDARSMRKSILRDFSHALNPNFRAQVGLSDMPEPVVSAMFFRIGELVAIEKEYHELKDRMLDLPKMKILERENRDITSGNHGGGIIGRL